MAMVTGESLQPLPLSLIMTLVTGENLQPLPLSLIMAVPATLAIHNFYAKSKLSVIFHSSVTARYHEKDGQTDGRQCICSFSKTTYTTMFVVFLQNLNEVCDRQHSYTNTHHKHGQSSWVLIAASK